MAYFNELPDYIRDEVWDKLLNQVVNDKQHRQQAKDCRMAIIDYAVETVDHWINCNNYDLSNSGWINQTETADI